MQRVAVGPDAAAVLLDELLADVQPEPEPRRRRPALASAVVRVEDLDALVPFETGPVVEHRDDDAVLSRDRDGRRSPGAVLRRVREEIRENLVDAPRVDLDDGDVPF